MSLSISQAIKISKDLPFSIGLAYRAIGVLGSYFIYNKLLDISEYIIIKKFGDYDSSFHLQKTLDNRVIVSMSRKNYWYVIPQNIALCSIMASTAVIAAKILLLAGFSTTIVAPLLVASIVTPIFMGLKHTTWRMMAHNCGGNLSKWVQLTDEEVKARGIKIDNVRTQDFTEMIYFGFGQPAKRVYGSDSELD